jgi:hypothetical protein
MAVIYLRHPKHGEKVASTEFEANEDRKNGWEDFDPTVKAELPDFLSGGKSDPVESDLPEDFPGREVLIENGVTTWEALVDKTDEELLALKGIGPATAKAIREKLDS